MTPHSLIIAIDGPAGAGKGTLARRIASHYGFAHLDTGLTYRAAAYALLAHGLPLENASAAQTAAAQVDLKDLDPLLLSAHRIGEAASRIAVLPGVRKVLVDKQREFARNARPGAVLDGRDIGTVVWPDAAAKLFVTASAEVRARRRYEEMAVAGESADLALILADIERRDARDMGREDSPLAPAADAYLLDTSQMDIEAAFRAAVSLIDAAIARSTRSSG